MSADILTTDLVADVIADLRPVIGMLLTQDHVARSGLALSVAVDLGQGALDLGAAVIGDLSANPYPNDDIARQKRDLSLRMRLPGSQVPAHAYRAGDSQWVGSAYVEGIAVGCAGLTEEQDEMVAHWVAHAIRARAVAARRQANAA